MVIMLTECVKQRECYEGKSQKNTNEALKVEDKLEKLLFTESQVCHSHTFLISHS